MPEENRFIVLISEILFVLRKGFIYYINEKNKERLYISLFMKKKKKSSRPTIY